MKNIYHYIFIVLSSFIIQSCSNDFLNNYGDLEGYEFTDIVIFEKENGEQEKEIDLQIPFSESYKIKQYPDWLKPTDLKGNIKDGIFVLNYTLDNDALDKGNYLDGYVVLEIKSMGLLLINVRFQDLGEPQFYSDNKGINFELDKVYSELRFRNVGNNLSQLLWEVEYKPDWITVDELSGSLKLNEIQTLYLECNREGYERGEYDDELIIKTNDINLPYFKLPLKMTVRGKGNPSNILSIDGVVTSARYNKINDKLYVLTQLPNKILVYNSGILENQIDLPKAPNCFNLSEDGNSAYVGYSGLMSEINLENNQITKSVDLSFNVYDIVYGENNCCYMTCTTNSFYGYFIVNLSNENTYELSNYSSSIYSHTNLAKIKGKNLIVATRTYISPSGIILLDISTEKGEEIKYWHKDIGTKIWFTEDGQYMIGSGGLVTKTIDEKTGENIHELGRLRNSGYSTWIDHNENKNIFWTVHNDYQEINVRAYEDSGYNEIYAFKSEQYYTTIDGVTDFYNTEPYYIFSNKVGSDIYIIRNVYNNYGDNNNSWSIEIKNVEDI